MNANQKEPKPMSDSIFDPATFMPETTEAGSTSAPICEPGEYPGVIDKAEIRVITSGPNSKVPGRQMPIIEVTYKLEHPQFEKDFGRKPTVRQTIWLDMNGVKLDMGPGKNISLNKLRAAVGQNKAGQKWDANMLVGAGPVKVMVKNTPDRQNPDTMRAEVATVGKM